MLCMKKKQLLYIYWKAYIDFPCHLGLALGIFLMDCILGPFKLTKRKQTNIHFHCRRNTED